MGLLDGTQGPSRRAELVTGASQRPPSTRRPTRRGRPKLPGDARRRAMGDRETGPRRRVATDARAAVHSSRRIDASAKSVDGSPRSRASDPRLPRLLPPVSSSRPGFHASLRQTTKRVETVDRADRFAPTVPSEWRSRASPARRPAGTFAAFAQHDGNGRCETRIESHAGLAKLEEPDGAGSFADAGRDCSTVIGRRKPLRLAAKRDGLPWDGRSSDGRPSDEALGTKRWTRLQTSSRCADRSTSRSGPAATMVETVHPEFRGTAPYRVRPVSLLPPFSRRLTPGGVNHRAGNPTGSSARSAQPRIPTGRRKGVRALGRAGLSEIVGTGKFRKRARDPQPA